MKDVKALDNVSFKVYPNEINAIIGHSGSGKSTVINLLYRLHKVTSGTILIDNVNIYDYTNHIYAIANNCFLPLENTASSSLIIVLYPFGKDIIKS